MTTPVEYEKRLEAVAIFILEEIMNRKRWAPKTRDEIMAKLHSFANMNNCRSRGGRPGQGKKN